MADSKFLLAQVSFVISQPCNALLQWCQCLVLNKEKCIGSNLKVIFSSAVVPFYFLSHYFFFFFINNLLSYDLIWLFNACMFRPVQARGFV